MSGWNVFIFRTFVHYSEVTNCAEDEDTEDNEEEDDNEDILPKSTNGLLFVHQTNNQKRLLQRYGNELSLLDATYKTTKYTLALFFLVAKTNVNYQIVE